MDIIMMAIMTMVTRGQAFLLQTLGEREGEEGERGRKEEEGV